jgi:hypothetical protein
VISLMEFALKLGGGVELKIGFASQHKRIVITRDLAERGKAGLSPMLSLLFDAFKIRVRLILTASSSRIRSFSSLPIHRAGTDIRMS